METYIWGNKMKIILSRKGFDTTSGGCPSPILPDGTLLTMPIPDNEALKYSDLQYNGCTYDRILSSLKPGRVYDGCHLDPDIREGVRVKVVNNWVPAFGQTGSALGILRNAGVAVGDLFLFFGIFRQTEYDPDGNLRFVKKKKPIQIIHSYLQIGEILDTPSKIKRCSWHPHASVKGYHPERNVVYLPCQRLSIHPAVSGCGVLSYREDRVLTMEDRSAANWKEHSFLMPDHIIGSRKNSAKNGGIYYQGQWQELVLKPSESAEQWAKKIICE